MSVKYVRLMPDSERLTNSESGDDYEYTLVIICSGALEDVAVIQKDRRIPQPNSYYQLHGKKITDAILSNREFTKIGEKVWTVRVTFTVPSPEKPDGGGDKPKPPANHLKPAVVSWGERTIEVYDSKDVNGKPYVNSAGDKISPPPKLKSIGILTIKTSQRYFDRDTAFAIRNKVNSDEFAGCAPMTLLAKQPAATTAYDETLGHYVEVTYTFEHDVDGWWPTKVLDQGNLVKVENLDKNSPLYHQEVKVIPRDELGREYDGLVLLDGKGRKLEEGKAPYYLKFTQYKLYPFRSLGLN